MAFNKYEDVLSISKFAGINQNTDGHNQNMGYAVSGLNFDTSHGGLKPFHKAVRISSQSTAGVDTSLPLSVNGDGALTLAFMTRRWQLDAGIIGKADSYTNKYCIVVVDGRLYYRRSAQGTFDGCAWTEILNPATGLSFAFAQSKFDCITYELNYFPPVTITSQIIAAIYAGSTYFTFDLKDYDFYEVHSDDGLTAYYTDRHDKKHDLTSTSRVRVQSAEAPMDCLLMTNAQDGMYCIYSLLDTGELKIARVPVMPDGTTQEICFGALARYAERIWGTAIDTDPDKLMYSAPYDVFNWEQYNDVPENGAGDIQQPNWDGDKFVAIKQFGSNLLAIKQHAIWRITGTNPSEFNMRKQYGEGTIAEDSLVVNGAYAYMLTDDDVKVYDGSSTQHYRYAWVKDFLSGLMTDEASLHSIIGRMVQDRYVLQIRHDYEDHIFLIFNVVEGTVNVCQSEGATALETFGEELYGLYPESTYDSEGDVTGTYVQLGKFLTDQGEQFDVEWVSAWIDLGLKHVIKSGFLLYLMFDCEGNPQNATINPTVTMMSEKKVKEKTVVMPYNRVKRIRLNANGRQFKLKLNIPAQSKEWKISTGIQIYLEYDAD